MEPTKVILGVRELADGRTTAYKIANITTIVLVLFLISVRLLLPYVDPSLWVGSVSQFSIFTLVSAGAMWTIVFLLHYSGVAGGMTLNTDLGGDRLRDYSPGAMNIFGSTESHINRLAGRIAISQEGISGIIKLPWAKVRSVAVENQTVVRIDRRTSWQSAPILLAFKTQADVTQFMEGVARYRTE